MRSGIPGFMGRPFARADCAPSGHHVCANSATSKPLSSLHRESEVMALVQQDTNLVLAVSHD
jgi:hypothetical protein